MILNWVSNNASSHLNSPKAKGFFLSQEFSFHSFALWMRWRKISEAQKKCMEQYIFWLTECNYADSIWLAFIFPAIFVHSSGWMAACVRLDHFLWYCVCNANIYLKSFECDRNGRDWEAFEKSPLFVLLSSFVVLCWVIFVLVSSEIFQHSIFRLGWDGKRRTIKDYAFGKYQRMKWRASVLLRWQRKLQKCRQRSSLP